MKKNQFILLIIYLLIFFPVFVIASQKPKERSGIENPKPTEKKGLELFLSINARKSVNISDHLFGIFFEDLNYAADGGLYAELIQNRSFEYSPADRKGWNPLTSWEYTNQEFGYGNISVETTSPLNNNNPHYILLSVEDEGHQGVGLTNSGFDGIPVRVGDKYNFSAYIRQISESPIPFEIRLQNKKGENCGESAFIADSKSWKKYSATITAIDNNDSCSFVILAKSKGKFALDEVSLFPQKTFKNRSNGLRADLAQTIADLKPKFIRFPGGCLVHGDGLANMYRWKNTIGPIGQRIEQRNIWNYHQSVGLGYFEYFQFCEDIGAKPLPVVPAAVSCQNSGGTWRIGGTGQRGLPLNEMDDYIQEILDLIEYANGPATSTWGSKRAEAGHNQPFNLEYIGVGNEDKQTPEFRERFKLIYDVIKAKYPAITIIGTVGPFPDGEDFEQGWKFANANNVNMVDEHYYKEPEWFLKNLHRYDTYDRKNPGVYVGEYAAHDVKRKNTLRSALAEAAYMASLERNGDVVTMASYAPLLAKQGHTQWIPDLIYFNNTEVKPSVNYYVQQLYGQNAGDSFLSSNRTFSGPFKKDEECVISVVSESRSSDLIIKLVNYNSAAINATIKLKGVDAVDQSGIQTVLTGLPEDLTALPQTTLIKMGKEFTSKLPSWSFTVIRVQTKN